MKNLIKKILREETEEQVLKIPGLRYFGDISTTKGRFEAWNEILKFTNGRKFIILGDFNLRETPITSLGNLQSVGGFLDLFGASITSLGNLQSVGVNLFLRGTPLSKKFTEEEIRQMVNIGEDIYL